MRAKSILAADPDRSMRSALFTALTRLGYAVELAEDADEALDKARSQPFDLAVCDLKLGRGGPCALLRELKKIRPELPVVVMSGGGGLEEAVGAMREGAQDYLLKPFPAEAVETAAARAFARAESRILEEEPARPLPGGAGDGPGSAGERPIVSASPVMARLLGLARNLANSSATVLLQGESGTGKELLARYIHTMSPRAAGPFVAVNCAGLPESLLESELFGHEKGAFTGALSRKAGKFDLASGGTLLLDEISEMDISLQAKLLRALQEGEIDPVGGKGPHKVDVRVIATTNRRLKDWVDEGKFRADLYYRLYVMPFFIPALRERREDIVPLSEHFLGKYSLQYGRSVRGFTPEALEALLAHDWPGNIRELENAVARAVLMTAGDSVDSQDIFMDEAGFMAALEKNSEVSAAAEAAAAEAAKAAAASAAPEGAPESAVAAAFEARPKDAGAYAAAGDSAEGAGSSLAYADSETPAGAGVILAVNDPESRGRACGFGQDFASHASLEEAGEGPLEASVSGVASEAAGALFGAAAERLPVMTIEQMERRLIGRALDETSGNRTHAARLLGISVRTLRNKLNEYRNGALQETSAAAG
ncbi:MAG: sigma 54-interacting transcriptional regulator [Deltaproteobacteria bacterium]|jgi:two-component system response regulator FlrC|nr:sigma 54-interacting transcriptional regulator [Deltaproteobacteria bacterium]